MKEHCGVLAIYSMENKPVAERIVKGLAALQHRGQESWGIAVPGEPILKGLGLIGQGCLLYTSPSPRDLSTSRMPSSA